MTNTVIALKKSAIPSAVPVDLANGELAINYSDGTIYYKHANGTIASITGGGGGGNSFGTVNANGTLIVSDTAGDVLTLVPGSGITITGDAINDTITISSTSSGTTIFTANLGNNSSNTFNVAHNLNNIFVIPAVREYSTGYYVYPDIKTTTSNHIEIEFVNAPSTNQYAILVVG